MTVPPESPLSAANLPAGAVRDGVHVYPLRVYFEDTDAGGIVYYANYLRFAERARTEMLRCLGYPHGEMMARDGLAFAVQRCEIEYVRPAHLDDALEVHSGPVEIGAASLDLDQRVARGGEVIARMRVRLACIAGSGRPARLPPGLRGALWPVAAARAGIATASKERV